MIIDLLFVIFGILGLGMLLVVYGTLAKNRWGINVELPNCPQCNTQSPTVRTPRSRQQLLWGGWTCSVCQTEIDKWGRRIAPSHKGPAEARP